MTSLAIAPPRVGELLREWRQRRHLSQLDLASEAEVSTRHLSFVETGRAAPSRDMLLRLAERLNVPLRSRNELLHAGGFAATYSERPLDAPEMTVARHTVDAVLAAHAPFPALALALALDRRWTLVASNQAVPPLLAGIAAQLLEPPVNVLRLSLHPLGLAPRIANLGEWRHLLLTRLQQQIDNSGDVTLRSLKFELSSYPFTASSAPPGSFGGIAVPLRLRVPGLPTPLSFISTTTVFGTPVDVTLSELALECFYPADDATRAVLMRQAVQSPT